MDSTHVRVTNTRLNLVSEASLAEGTYTIQNKSEVTLAVWLRDAIVSDPSSLELYDASFMQPNERATIEVSGTDAVYVGQGTDRVMDRTPTIIVWIADG